MMFQLDASGITRSRQGYLFAYAQIAFNQLRRYMNLQVAIDRHNKDREHLRDRVQAGDLPPREELAPKGWRSFTLEFELQAEELECRILAALSTALFLEAYIYDYCARRESGSFTRKYIDRLDAVAKWLIVPRLIVPPGLDLGHDAFERLRKLFALRNELVHHKTKGGEDFTLPPEFPPDLQPTDCVKLIVDLLTMLQAADPTDEFGGFVVRHIGSWVRYVAKDSDFYPILWEASQETTSRPPNARSR